MYLNRSDPLVSGRASEVEDHCPRSPLHHRVLILPSPLTLLYLSPRTVSSAGVLGAHLLCSRVPGLTPRQSRICTRAPDAMVAISEGARAGLQECQRQFQHHRWNCSLASTGSSAFGHVVLVGQWTMAGEALFLLFLITKFQAIIDM